jgi:hypothetical protein
MIPCSTIKEVYPDHVKTSIAGAMNFLVLYDNSSTVASSQEETGSAKQKE